MMAVLGAKRPQDRAWQLIVLSLLGVLSLPAIQDVVYHYGQPVSLDPAWRWFVAVLLVVGLVNYLPTRYATSSVLVFAAQAVLLADFLPISPPAPDSHCAAVGLGLVAVASGVALAGWSRRRSPTDAMHDLWLDFRDWYGVLWALRVRERAASSTSPQTDGRARCAAMTERVHSPLATLRVREWIAARLKNLPDGEAAWRGGADE